MIWALIGTSLYSLVFLQYWTENTNSFSLSSYLRHKSIHEITFLCLFETSNCVSIIYFRCMWPRKRKIEIVNSVPGITVLEKLIFFSTDFIKMGKVFCTKSPHRSVRTHKFNSYFSFSATNRRVKAMHHRMLSSKCYCTVCWLYSRRSSHFFSPKISCWTII